MSFWLRFERTAIANESHCAYFCVNSVTEVVIYVCIFSSDVDECLEKLCPVNAIFRNTEGSYNCSCLPGMIHNKLTNLCEGEEYTAVIAFHTTRSDLFIEI